MPGLALLFDLHEGVFGHGIYIHACYRNIENSLIVEKIGLAAWLPVVFLVAGAGFLVISGQRRVCLVRNPVCGDCGIKNACQAIALDNVMIKKRKRFARLDGLDP